LSASRDGQTIAVTGSTARSLRRALRLGGNAGGRGVPRQDRATLEEITRSHPHVRDVLKEFAEKGRQGRSLGTRLSPPSPVAEEEADRG
jgi:hypothetical protein